MGGSQALMGGIAPIGEQNASVGIEEADLVVIGDLAVAGEALARLGEVRRAAPTAKVVILSSRPDASWLADALRADACAVLPGCVEPETLAIVLREVIAEGDGERTATPAAIELARERSSRLDGRAARRRRVRVEPSQEGTAA